MLRDEDSFSLEQDAPRRALTGRILSSEFNTDEIRAWTRDIGRNLLSSSTYIREPNFEEIHPDDLGHLFKAYDQRFLNGLCRRALGRSDLAFRLSRRMTRAGGKTTRYRLPTGAAAFEIAIATSILFDGFRQGDPDVTVSGLPCADRLEALQRIFEHEIVHLAEFLCWDRTNCNAPRFQDIARRLFLHRAHTHQLITRRDRAANLGIRVGSAVTFSYEGRRLTGRVNRITTRATVLVESPRGHRYSDGRRYLKYYVPVPQLKPAGTRHF